MLYDILLTIAHHYERPVGQSRHMVRVLPKTDDQQQRINAHLIQVAPEPSELSETTDFFGNKVTSVAHFDAHQDMTITMNCRVDVQPAKPFEDVSPGLSDLRREIRNCLDLGSASPMHFLGPSPRLASSSEIAQFATEAVSPHGSVAEHTIRLGEALHAAMAFDTQATTVDTDPLDAFRQRKGVCQDFSHIMILGLRSLGIPASYASGYLRTLPPEGGVRLEGADAMHAWVRAWCGVRQGWIAYDPTNALIVGSDHIVVGYGRDYSDVSPVIGQLRSSGDQTNTQSVDVIGVN